jgi:hypothetical protein
MIELEYAPVWKGCTFGFYAVRANSQTEAVRLIRYALKSSCSQLRLDALASWESEGSFVVSRKPAGTYAGFGVLS